MEDQIIESKRGFVTYLSVILLLSNVSALLYVLVSIFQTAEYFSIDTLGLGLTIFACCWLASSVLTAKIKVSPQFLTYHSCWSKQTLIWEDFETVNAIPTFFGRYVIQVKHDNKRYSSLMTAHFSNHDLLLKAITEVAYDANPDVKLNAWLEAEYGKPPYGIFKEVKKAL